MKRTALTVLLLAVVLLAACGRAQTEKTVLTVEATPAAETAPQTEASAPGLADAYYGWWHINHTSGDWGHMYGYWWDCAAWVQETAPGEYSLTLRDEDMLEGTATAWCALRETDGGLICTEGRLLDADLKEGDWTVKRTEDDCGALLTISGRYTAVNSKGGFSYEFFLRPWGSRWPEKADELPYHYRDWYLPLIEAGEEMPPTLWNNNGKETDA